MAMDCLRSCVLKGSNECGEGISFLEHHSGKPVVSKFDVAIVGDQNVLWFELTIDDSFIVESLNADDDFSY